MHTLYPSARRLAQVLLLVALGGCGDRARIQGEVVDGFGKPVQDALISIQGSAYQARTDARGRYSLPYVPGALQLQYLKNGYTQRALSLNLAQASRFAAERQVLYALPATRGIHHLGHGEYTALKQGGIDVSTRRVDVAINDPNFYEVLANGAGLVETMAAHGTYTALQPAERFAFLDNDGTDQALFRLDAEGHIAERTYYRSLDHADEARVVNGTATQVADGVWLREYTLQPGRYAFATFSRAIREGDDSFGRRAHGLFMGRVTPLETPVYLFEVGASAPAAEPAPAAPRAAEDLAATMERFLAAVREENAEQFATFFSARQPWLFIINFYGPEEEDEAHDTTSVTFERLRNDLRTRGEYHSYFLNEQNRGVGSVGSSAESGGAWKRVAGDRFVPPESDENSSTWVRWRNEDGRWVVTEIAEFYH